MELTELQEQPSKLFFFNNLYISSIQQGIQALHAGTVLLRAYAHEKEVPLEQKQFVTKWADVHMVVALLNGGDDKRLIEIHRHLYEGPFPYASFYEEGMGDLLTSVCVLLPEYMYQPELDETGTVITPYTDWEKKLRQYIKESPSAK